jgi:hypothetical protein
MESEVDDKKFNEKLLELLKENLSVDLSVTPAFTSFRSGSRTLGVHVKLWYGKELISESIDRIGLDD